MLKMLRFYKKYTVLAVFLVVLITNLILNTITNGDKTIQDQIQVNYVRMPSEYATARATKGLSPKDVKGIIEIYNTKPEILNRHYLFGGEEARSLPNETLVLLVQVHNRVENLKILIESLSKVRHINETLLIFSHDVYNQTINSAVEGIKFASVLQIFYPFSLQVYSSSFPGKSENDCPVKVGFENASRLNCTNWQYPDKYGNYRDHRLVQIKHHWFWKNAFVFDVLHWTKQSDDLNVLLLEEDFFVFPDTLHMFRQLKDLVVKNETVEIISLSDTYIQHTKPDFQNTSGGYRYCQKHLCTSAMVLNRRFWSVLKSHVENFCHRDDYNWDWTLQYISAVNFNLPIKCVYPSAARVLHIDNCGLHNKFGECDVTGTAQKYQKMAFDFQKYFFPENLSLEKVQEIPHEYDMGNGGWADVRDHLLCKSFVNNTYLRTLKNVFKIELP